MDDEKMPLGKIATYLYRCTQAYTNEILKEYHLGSGLYPFLLKLYIQEGINQNQISRALNIDKAMSARAVKKLIEMGYIRKEEDHEDSRAFKLYLTEQGRAVAPVVKDALRRWNDMITQDLSEQEKDMVINLLGKVLNNAKSCINKSEGYEE